MRNVRLRTDAKDERGYDGLLCGRGHVGTRPMRATATGVSVCHPSALRWQTNRIHSLPSTEHVLDLSQCWYTRASYAALQKRAVRAHSQFTHPVHRSAASGAAPPSEEPPFCQATEHLLDLSQCRYISASYAAQQKRAESGLPSCAIRLLLGRCHPGGRPLQDRQRREHPLDLSQCHVRSPILMLSPEAVGHAGQGRLSSVSFPARRFVGRFSA